MIRLDKITKVFPGVKSLDSVSFEAHAGEIHALLGENGAGKSTLIKVIAGAYQPNGGTIAFDGKNRSWSNPGQARDAGIHVIYQELMLFPELTVAENIFIGEAPRTRMGLIDHAAMETDAREVLERLGHALDPRLRVEDCSVADRQMIEIARALVRDTRLLILDEPTAVLSRQEAEILFNRLRTLREAGVCIIYISHRLEEIFALADSVTVLKDGKFVGTHSVAAIDRDQLVGMMVGRDLENVFPAKVPTDSGAETVLQVRDLVAAPRVRGVSLDLRRGEILGLAGLVGSGRSELAHAIFGSLPRTSGSVLLDGQVHDDATPRRSIDRGLGFLTEDRKAEGLMLLLDMAANVSAPRLTDFRGMLGLDRRREHAVSRDEIARFNIAISGSHCGVVGLSGGNQQKILFARWARASRNVLILDEPTRGVDVGARVEIYRIIRDLADSGLGVLLISSDLPEVVGLCDRVAVMHEGRISGTLDQTNISEEAIMQLATGSTTVTGDAA
ncbi:sugar ABC transporter ATP-binding protein [Arenibacterium sp. LLYu02]|uniref:sugar ABC transporter ATP-binding protein n=1 Tax=Arenibacterium sp. LLYu02 TaxID=3404132 RepID=UPI003B214E1E